MNDTHQASFASGQTAFRLRSCRPMKFCIETRVPPAQSLRTDWRILTALGLAVAFLIASCGRASVRFVEASASAAVLAQPMVVEIGNAVSDNPAAPKLDDSSDAMATAQQAIEELKEASAVLHLAQHRFQKGEVDRTEVGAAERNRNAKIIKCQQTRAMLTKVAAR